MRAAASEDTGWRPQARKRRRAGWTLRLLGGAAALAAWALLRTPEFHGRAQAALEPDEAKRQSREVVRRGVKLLDRVMNGAARWDEEFAGPAVNAWLAEDFARNHASLLPRGAEPPAVEFDGDRARIGFRYGWGPFSTVVHATVRVWTPKNNLVAVELHEAAAGAVPLPGSLLRSFAEQAARSAGAGISWRRHEGRTVALVKLPGRGAAVQQVEVRDGVLHVAGRSSGILASALRAAAPAARR